MQSDTNRYKIHKPDDQVYAEIIDIEGAPHVGRAGEPVVRALPALAERICILLNAQHKGRLTIMALLVMCLCACGSPRGDGIPWESTYPHVGDSIADVDKLYGKPRSQTREPNGDDTRTYSNWRVKNQFNGMMHRSDFHTVTFHDGKAISWK